MARRAAGVSFLGVLVVVVVLGILATALTARYAYAVGDPERVAFCEQLRAHLAGIEAFHRDTGAYPPGASAGQLPAGLDRYLDADVWSARTPIGGQWDLEFEGLGVRSAVGVSYADPGAEPDAAFMRQLDATLDDGNLEDGAFRRFGAGRYYFVVLP